MSYTLRSITRWYVHPPEDYHSDPTSYQLTSPYNKSITIPVSVHVRREARDEPLDEIFELPERALQEGEEGQFKELRSFYGRDIEFLHINGYLPAIPEKLNKDEQLGLQLPFYLVYSGAVILSPEFIAGSTGYTNYFTFFTEGKGPCFSDMDSRHSHIYCVDRAEASFMDAYPYYSRISEDLDNVIALNVEKLNYPVILLSKFRKFII